jgi:hypothetical protein
VELRPGRAAPSGAMSGYMSRWNLPRPRLVQAIMIANVHGAAPLAAVAETTYYVPVLTPLDRLCSRCGGSFWEEYFDDVGERQA